MKITMIGTGYVGLVTGACLSDYGHTVTCIDIDKKKIELLNSGKIPIYEPGLEALVLENVKAGRLFFSTEYDPAVSQSDVVFIAVGTPASRRGDGYANLEFVHAAAKAIASHLTGYTVIVDKSTVPVGTARQVERIIRETNSQAEFDVVSNPEFLREGSAIVDFTHPDRIVIGTKSERAREVMREVYKPLYINEVPFVFTDPETSELIKYAANAFLAVKISFINEMSRLCEETNADVQELARGMGLDNRIGRKFLHAGPGYGGSCFPKDTFALMRTAQEHGVSCRIVEAAKEANASQKALMVKKIKKALGGNGSESGKKIAVLGLAFKPETDDVRDSPAISIVAALHEKGAQIFAHDPQAVNEAKKELPEDVVYCQDLYKAIEGADAVVLMTEWNEYRALDLARVKKSMKTPIFIDLRNVYAPEKMKAAGFFYHSVGRASAQP